MFTRPTGGSYHPANLSKLLGRMTSEIGLPRLTAHGLRHTSATLMLANGVPPKVAAERLGHADPSLFTNLYMNPKRDSMFSRKIVQPTDASHGCSRGGSQLRRRAYLPPR